MLLRFVQRQGKMSLAGTKTSDKGQRASRVCLGEGEAGSSTVPDRGRAGSGCRGTVVAASCSPRCHLRPQSRQTPEGLH